jgi:lysophospholipase L1-like esterase
MPSRMMMRPAWRSQRRGQPRLKDTTLWLDSFDGTGAITAHTPDLAPAGAAWAIGAGGGFGNLADGAVAGTTHHNSVATCDTGLTDYDAEAVVYQASGPYDSVQLAVRSNAAGTERYAAAIGFGVDYGNLQCLKYTALDARTVIGKGSTMALALARADHTLRVLCKGTVLRFGIDGFIYRQQTACTYTGTYVGIGTYFSSAGGLFKSVRLRSLPSETRITVLGDSIAIPSNYTGFPGWAELVSFNLSASLWGEVDEHGASGQSIAHHMPAAVTACAAETPSKIFVGYGYNDYADENNGTVYLAQLQALAAAHAGVKIYCLNVLPHTGAPDRGATANPVIAAAVAAAAAAGVNCVLLDTRAPSDWIVSATDTSDGIHPNAAGSLKIAQAVLARL